MESRRACRATGYRAEPGDRFGASITLSADGNRIVVGAPGEDVNSIKDAGAVSVLSLCDSCPGGADLYATLDQNSSGVPGSALPAASSARLSPSGPTSPAGTLSALLVRASVAMVAQAL